MKKKTAVVFGANGGIGFATVRDLITKDFFVGAFYNRNRQNLDDLMGDQFKAISLDLLDGEKVRDQLRALIAEREHLDVIVYSVTAGLDYKNILSLEWSDFQKHFDVQVHGMINVLHALKEQIQTKKPTKFLIILTDACVGQPPAGLSHYVMAKYALMGLAKAMASDLARYNCTVNMISPGMVETDLLKTLPSKLVEITAGGNPLKKIASSRDVAATISFLASSEADYINGANILINGGRNIL
jgi:3-oxoacyl-[acyl-carrier protein] reductase